MEELPQIYPTVVHMLAAAVERAPDREALVLGAKRLTYREYWNCVTAFASSLGSIKRERVAILLPNSIESCIATFGALAAGAQVVPLNPLYTERELEQILADAGPRVLIFDASRTEVAALATRLGITQPIAIRPGASPLLVAGTPRGFTITAAPDSLAFIQYTGGTTGRSKGVMLTHRAVSTNVSQREWALPTDSSVGERNLCVMPLFHSYALAMGLFLTAYCAGTLVILPRYRPDDVLDAFRDERITIFPGSPTIFTGLMRHERFASTDFSRIHTYYSGSAPLPADTLDRWESATGARIYEGYGQTEAGPVITYVTTRSPRQPGTVGVALPQTDIQIVDTETGTRLLAIGEPGEIRVRGPQLMTGYRNLPDATREALRDGWLYTGDIGSLDEQGVLTIRDRKKDMIIVSGYNVYPREVEDVLLAHPAVSEAAVVGRPDEYRGEKVAAYVITRSMVTPDELAAHCAGALAKYKLPATIEIRESLPKTPVGKLDRKALREH